MQIDEPRDFQLLQRGANEKAPLNLRITEIPPGTRRLEVSITTEAGLRRWPAEEFLIEVNGDSLSGRATELDTGGPYRVRLAALDEQGRLLEDAAVDHILVGDLWLLGGQSNMVGFGQLQNLEPPRRTVTELALDNRWRVAEDPVSDPFVATAPVQWITTRPVSALPGTMPQILEREGYKADDPLTTSREPLPQAVRDAAAEAGVPWNQVLDVFRPTQTEVELNEWYGTLGASLGVAFGAELAERAKIPVALLPVAVGGSSISQWSRELRSFGNESLYGSMMDRIDLAGGRVKGMLWYQGESDANPQDRDQWAERTRQFVDDVRRDLGQPDLPFLYVQIGRWLDGPDADSWSILRSAQYHLERRMEHAHMVSAVFGTTSDPIHLDALSQRKLGRQLAQIARATVYGHDDLHTGPRFERAERSDKNPRVVRLVFSGVAGSLSVHSPKAAFFFNKTDLSLFFPPPRITVSPDAPNELLAIFQEEPPEQMLLSYGDGTNPIAAVEDEDGFAMPCFHQIPIRL